MWENILQKKARGSARRVDHNALTEAVRTVTEELDTFLLEDVMDDIKNEYKNLLIEQGASSTTPPNIVRASVARHARVRVNNYLVSRKINSLGIHRRKSKGLYVRREEQ